MALTQFIWILSLVKDAANFDFSRSFTNSPPFIESSFIGVVSVIIGKVPSSSIENSAWWTVINHYLK